MPVTPTSDFAPVNIEKKMLSVHLFLMYFSWGVSVDEAVLDRYIKTKGGSLFKMAREHQMNGRQRRQR